jgi:predicted nucleic acid-binding protein
VNFLLDTNIVSEWVKPHPNAGVIDWLAEADEDRVFISAVTIAEIRYGIERLPRGVRRDRLNAWLTDDLPFRFENRILPIDAKVGDCWAVSWPEDRTPGDQSHRWTPSSPRQASGMIWSSRHGTYRISKLWAFA